MSEENTEQTNPKYVYELVDATDDDQYLAMGIYLDPEDAIGAAMHGDTPPSDYEDDCIKFEVRERVVGSCAWSAKGKVIATIKWEELYNDVQDDFAWEKELVRTDKPKEKS